MKKTFCVFFICYFFVSLLAAYPVPQYVGHSGKVNDCIYAESSGTFFTAGDDGFICEWNNEVKKDSYQVSALPIAKIALNAVTGDIAVYESDGFATHKVSVWDWKKKNRKYTKRFSDSILSLEYSAKGTWLIVSSASLDGLTFFASLTGKQQQLISDIPMNVMMAQTSATEATLVTYSADGLISYFDMKNGSEKGQFITESNISDCILHRNNMYLTGRTGDTSFITINMTNGDVVKSYNETDTTISYMYCHASYNDSEPVFMEHFSNQILTRTYNEVLRKTESPLPEYAPITAAAYGNNRYIAGTANGEIVFITEQNSTNEKYSDNSLSQDNQEQPAFSDVIHEENENSSELTKKILSVYIAAADILQPIHDIVFVESESCAYVLTEGNLFKQDAPNAVPQYVTAILPEYNRIAEKGSSLVFWSSTAAVPIIMINRMNLAAEPVVLYTPESLLSSFTVAEDFSVVIENHSKVTIIDTVLKQALFSYNGTGLQNGIYNHATGMLFVAKTAASQPRSILLRIDVATGETVPVLLSGAVLYAMTANNSKTKAFGYIISEHDETSQVMTELVEIDLDKLTVKRIAKYDAENITAFLTYSSNRIYTDLSTNAISEINIANSKQIKQMILRRGNAIPSGIKVADDYLLVLNMNGTYSWYSKKTLNQVSVIQYSTAGDWNIEQ